MSLGEDPEDFWTQHVEHERGDLLVFRWVLGALALAAVACGALWWVFPW